MKREKGFLKSFGKLFDFSWKRISILWVGVSLFAMFIFLLGNLLISNSETYKNAIVAIENSEQVLEKSGGILDYTFLMSSHSGSNMYHYITIGIIGKTECFSVTAEFYLDEDDNDIDGLIIND